MQTFSLRLTWAVAAAFGALVLGSDPAFAQIDPESGEIWEPGAEAQQQQPAPAAISGEVPWYHGGPTGSAEPEPASESAPEAADGENQSDHRRVIGRLAVGYMGASTVPIGDLALAAAGESATLTTPSLGVRYWLDELIGIDVGLGIGVIGGTLETSSNAFPVDSAFGLLIHGGVPLAIYHEKHYKFLIIPEMNLGFSTGTHHHMTDSDFDQGRSGFLFQIGGRLGTEIHFGFMNIPQLSLQASVGLYFQYMSAGVGSDRAGVAERVSIDTYSLATSVQGEPWDILLGSLTALYYF